MCRVSCLLKRAETSSSACPSRTFGKNNYICLEKESCALVSVNGRIKVYVIFCAIGLGLTDHHSLFR